MIGKINNNKKQFSRKKRIKSFIFESRRLFHVSNPLSKLTSRNPYLLQRIISEEIMSDLEN